MRKTLCFLLLLSLPACATIGKAPPPGDYGKLTQLAGIYQQQGRFAASEPLLRDALRSRPRGPEANALMGDAMLVRGEFGGAVLHYRASLASNPSSAVVLNNLAMAEIGLKKGGLALEAVDQALALSPQPLHPFLDTRARALALLKRDADARAEGEKALSLWPPSDPEGRAQLEEFLGGLP